jgi:hypothetical protein
MHRGPAGAGNLNLALQEALTPFRDGQPERRYGGRVFRVGDKVTQLRNNYDKGKAGIFNGTVGVVTGLYLEEQILTVLTDEDEPVDYDFGELDAETAIHMGHSAIQTDHRHANFFHWLGAVITTPRIIGNKWTPVRKVIDRAAALSRLLDDARTFHELAREGEDVLADLWHYKDDYVQPMQKVRAQQERSRSYRAVYHIAEKKFVQLADPTMPGVNPSDPATTTAGLSLSIRSMESSQMFQSGAVPSPKFGAYFTVKQSPVKRTRSSGTQTDRFVGVCPGVRSISTAQLPRSNSMSL